MLNIRLNENYFHQLLRRAFIFPAAIRRTYPNHVPPTDHATAQATFLEDKIRSNTKISYYNFFLDWLDLK